MSLIKYSDIFTSTVRNGVHWSKSVYTLFHCISLDDSLLQPPTVRAFVHLFPFAHFLHIDDLKMPGLPHWKQLRRGNVNPSEDLRKTALHNAFWQRLKDNAGDLDASQWSSILDLPPLRPAADGSASTWISSSMSAAHSRVLPVSNLRRSTTASHAGVPFRAPRQPREDRQHLCCSPTRRNKPQANLQRNQRPETDSQLRRRPRSTSLPVSGKDIFMRAVQ